MKQTVDQRRILELSDYPSGNGPVVYIMSRDQRVDDNWAFLFAQETAIASKQPLIVISAPMADYPRATRRQVAFSLDGISAIEKKLKKLAIPMHIISGDIPIKLSRLIKKIDAALVVVDFSPLRPGLQWRQKLIQKLKIPVYEVDAHNIVPCRVASPKLEYAAYTIRPKIKKLLAEFLTEFPRPVKHPFPYKADTPAIMWAKIEKSLIKGHGPDAVSSFIAGEDRAHEVMHEFLNRRLPDYHQSRNDPNIDAQSGLSPYLHFGQISAQRVALEAHKHDQNIKSQEAFLEELIIRRELSDNFCFYNNNYDSFDGLHQWARKTLNEHRTDPREYVYSIETLEDADTHDDLWNAAQTEMVITGKMHGYMRMYWAKKILEWSISPEEALAAAIYLNDKYELDGCDPNGYAGIAWSIGGLHDRPWFERDIFGKVRFMSYNGCKRKFDIKKYIHTSEQLRAGAGS